MSTTLVVLATFCVLLCVSVLETVEGFSAPHIVKKEQQKHQVAPPPHDPLGPPPLISNLQVGSNPPSTQQSISSTFTQQSISDSLLLTQQSILHHSIQRLSNSPHIFLLRNVVSPDDCKSIIDQATNGTMVPAGTTEDNGLRRYSRVAWLPNNDSMIREMGRTTGNLLLSTEVKSCPGAGCEDLQVVHYHDTGGEFVLHHDGIGRILTVIYYLNGVAGTWFPLADHQQLEEDDDDKNDDVPLLLRRPKDREEALEIVKNYKPGQDGLVVVGKSSPLLVDANPENVAVVEPGDAVAFYNYYNYREGRDVADWRSIHAGLPTTAKEGDKWIANHWMHAPALFSNTKSLYSE